MKNFKLYRWWKGGVWVMMDDGEWIHGEWNPYLGDNEYFDPGYAVFHRTYLGILKIEDYTKGKKNVQAN